MVCSGLGQYRGLCSHSLAIQKVFREFFYHNSAFFQDRDHWLAPTCGCLPLPCWHGCRTHLRCHLHRSLPFICHRYYHLPFYVKLSFKPCMDSTIYWRKRICFASEWFLAAFLISRIVQSELRSIHATFNLDQKNLPGLKQIVVSEQY